MFASDVYGALVIWVGPVPYAYDNDQWPHHHDNITQQSVAV